MVCRVTDAVAIAIGAPLQRPGEQRAVVIEVGEPVAIAIRTAVVAGFASLGRAMVITISNPVAVLIAGAPTVYQRDADKTLPVFFMGVAGEADAVEVVGKSRAQPSLGPECPLFIQAIF